MVTREQNIASAAECARYINDMQARLGSDAPNFGGDLRRLDADETAMLAQQLEHLRSKVYEQDYPLLKAKEILPIENDTGDAEYFSWEETASVGAFKVISDDGYADDPPSSEVLGRKLTRRIRDLGGVVHHTIADLRRAAFSGRPIVSRKLEAMRRAYETQLNTIAFLGDGDAIETGLANIPTGTGAGQIRSTAVTSAAWDSTPDAAVMISDLNAAVTAYLDVNEARVPSDLILPRLQYMRFHQTYTTDTNAESAAARWLRDNGYVTKIHSEDSFKSVDAGGTGSRGLLFERDVDSVSLVIAQDFTMLPPQPENFAFKTLAYARTAGTVVYRPTALRYLTGLPNT